MNPRSLNVWWDGQIVGQWTQNEHGELGFAHASGWLVREDAPSLLASLLKRAETFSRRECHPFFGGLLPEENQRNAVAGTGCDSRWLARNRNCRS
jgi:serine/threonine-protein kinase HipA